MRYPRIYDLNLRRTGELRTAEITDLKLKDTPLSCVTVTVPTKDIGSFGYRQFVEIFDAAGKRIDLFRVTEIPKGVYSRAGTKKLKCDQVLCTLSDDITPTYMQIGGNGQPLESCIRQVLACQQTARWKLGRCDFATLYEYSFASEGLLSALLKLIEPIPDALMTTDTSSYPWTLNVVRADDTDATELRYSRNMEEISEEVLDTDFATRLYPLGYGEGVNQLNIKSVNGGTAYIDSPTQALWGVVSKPYVDTTITDAATLLAQGRAALELCCNPHVSYGVTCKDISILTGEPLDAFYTGRMARIIYRDYGLTIRARVREIHYPKPITEPWNAKLTIANRSADVASVIAQLQRTSRIEQLYGQGSTTSAGEHSHGMSHWHSVDGHTHSLGGHSHAMTHWHAIDPHTHSLGNHTHDMTHRHEFQHYHQMNISLLVPSQTLNLPEHRHSVNIPAHTHEVNVPEHVHGIEYGMYSGPTAEEYIVEVDGKELPTDAFTGGVGDIAPYLSADGDGKIRRGTFHTFAVRPKGKSGNEQGLAHIRASWSAQVFISCQTGRQY